MTGTYDTALICLSGHVLNEDMTEFPEDNRDFCERCGARSISSCPKCQKAIRGGYTSADTPVPFEYELPAYCLNCGKPFPWTESRLMAAHDLIEELDELSPEERTRLEGSIAELTRDSPQTPVAATRVKKIALKVGKGSWALLEKVLTSLATEEAKKMLGLP